VLCDDSNFLYADVFQIFQIGGSISVLYKPSMKSMLAAMIFFVSKSSLSRQWNRCPGDTTEIAEINFSLCTTKQFNITIIYPQL
jgi:hypothetical protein